MVYSDFGSDTLELCSGLAVSLATAGRIIRQFLDARVHWWTLRIRDMCDVPRC